MILMSKYKGKHGGKKVKKIRARPSPPPPFWAMPERNRFLLWEVFPYLPPQFNGFHFSTCYSRSLGLDLNTLEDSSPQGRVKKSEARTLYAKVGGNWETLDNCWYFGQLLATTSGMVLFSSLTIRLSDGNDAFVKLCVSILCLHSPFHLGNVPSQPA